MNQTKHKQFILKVFKYSEQCVQLTPGETLLKQGQDNERLYFVIKGSLNIVEDNIDIGEGALIGLQSFFSPEVLSQATVIALDDCELLYIEASQVFDTGDESQRRDLTQMITFELQGRARRIKELERAEFLQEKRIREVESLALLGKLSAGIAHELNNAISVITSGSYWLEEIASEMLLSHFTKIEKELFLHGLHHGRPLACSVDESTLIIAQTQEIMKKSKLSYSEARQIARLQLPPELATKAINSKKQSDALQSWELGATFHDLKAASHQATHVVQSMRDLGTAHSKQNRKVDIRQTIKSALAILQNSSKGINIKLHADTDLLYQGQPGELVQIWVNIIQNACDAILASPQADTGEISISATKNDQQIQVQISNNGPEIPPDLLPQIFNPDVTTKKSGLSFGLGIGLTLVKRLVSQHYGEITVNSNNDSTCFTITFPLHMAENSENPGEPS